jgi:hypothetical protein
VATSVVLIALFGLFGLATTTPGFAQAPDDDIYGVPGASKPGTPETPVTSEPPAPVADSQSTGSKVEAPVVVSTDTAKVSKPAPRPRITRETTINPLDTRRGNYRNPKKALFMSLMVPGLGQAYVGQTAFNYARAALYFGTEISLGVLWYEYTVVKYDREVKRYRRYADEHWSSGRYEDEAFAASATETFKDVNPYRTSYCETLVDRESASGAGLYRGCVNLLIPDSANQSSSYQNFRSTNPYDDKSYFAPTPNPEGLGLVRAQFADPVEFYALIGSYQEFISGWDDATGVSYNDTTITGTSSTRDRYNAMRDKAQDYSRMQAWFIGGLVVNHIASAIDAALTARRNNRILYEGEARWYDNLGVNGGLAFEQGRPRTRMSAVLSF